MKGSKIKLTKMIGIKLRSSDPRKELINATRYSANKLFKKQIKLLRRYRIGIKVREYYLERNLESKKWASFLLRNLFKRTSEENLNKLLEVSTLDIKFLEEKEKTLKTL